MSMELYVAVGTVALPTADRITAMLSERQVVLRPDSIDWASHSGFLPMASADRESGAEVDVFPANDVQPSCDLIPRSAGKVVVLRWGADLLEGGCALAFGAAVAALSGGVIVDPQENKVLTVEEAVAQAKECLSTES